MDPLDPVRRHAAAVRRTLSWADEAADRGDYVDALAWLAVIQAVDGELPEDFLSKHAEWLRLSETRHRSRSRVRRRSRAGAARSPATSGPLDV